MRLTLAFCSAKPNWMPRKPKHMFQICQKRQLRFAVHAMLSSLDSIEFPLIVMPAQAGFSDLRIGAAKSLGSRLRGNDDDDRCQRSRDGADKRGECTLHCTPRRASVCSRRRRQMHGACHGRQRGTRRGSHRHDDRLHTYSWQAAGPRTALCNDAAWNSGARLQTGTTDRRWRVGGVVR